MSTLSASSYEQCALVTESATNVLKDYYANTSIDTSLSLHGRIDLFVFLYQVYYYVQCYVDRSSKFRIPNVLKS